MTEYKKEFPFNNLFPPEVPQNTLAEWLSKKSVAQFHCAGNDIMFALVWLALTVWCCYLLKEYTDCVANSIFNMLLN